jgi:CDP-diacylglycerol--glycerol-3-phosphate 3-phosphatidyltransferase
MTVEIFDQKSTLALLRLRWAAFCLTCVLSLGGGVALLQASWGSAQAFRWLVPSTLVIVYLLWVLWRGLPHNHRQGESLLLPAFGAGNHLTLLRGVLVAALVGFLFLPVPGGWLAWLPGVLYTLACITDFLDGYLARVTNHATRLGEILDLKIDGVGVFATGLLAVEYGKAPAWYLLIPLARYLFVAGLWLRQRAGKAVYELPPSTRRRAFAGVQMCFIAAILMPVFTPPGTHLAALLFALPFLTGFCLDWLYASGLLRPVLRPNAHSQGNTWANLERWLPLLLRLSAALVLAWSISMRVMGSSYPPAFAFMKGVPFSGTILTLLSVCEAVVLLLLVAGAAGRVTAIFGLLLAGINQALAGLTFHQAFLICAYTAILFMGTGKLSLWTPEDHLIYHRLGEKRAGAPANEADL